ncbi:MAG: SDR family NAD(P)-dependent oxidoreductase [Planctomycetaceae bacterium]
MPQYTERMTLANKRALITGGSRGLGAEIAQVFADAGADLVITGRDRAGLEQTQGQVQSLGRRCHCIEADLRTVEGAREVGRKTLEHFGTVDILVNNAGIVHVHSLLEATVEEWEETQHVNLRAPWLLSQAVAPGMIAQRAGKIVNISSSAAVQPPEDHGAYCAAKGGLNVLTQAMAAEWARHNIQANAVAPTVVLTAMGKQVWGDPQKGDPKKARIPAGRFGEPIEVADLVLFLASPASNWICGQVIRIDGGLSAV